MKKVLVPLIAILALTFSATAQGKMDKMGKKGQHQHQQKGMIAKQLNFSDAQKAQAKIINEDARKKMQELNKNENITVKEQRDRKAAIQKERKTKMDGLLTAEQKTKQTQLKAEHKAKKEERYAKQMDKMKISLNLSDEQVVKLKAQRAASHAKAEKIKNNESLSREQKKEQMMALKTEAKAQDDKILTPEQFKKKEEMKKNRGDRSKSKK
jgi:Spy/CpxP family protein refolding chaperone